MSDQVFNIQGICAACNRPLAPRDIGHREVTGWVPTSRNSVTLRRRRQTGKLLCKGCPPDALDQGPTQDSLF